MSDKIISFDKEATKSIAFNIGVSLAVCMSWGVNGSILWSIIHGFFGWFYVIYYLVKF